MKSSLQGKMILSYLAVALITVLVVSALIRLTSGQSLMNLVLEQQTALLKESAQNYYATNGAMDGFFDSYIQMKRLPPGEAPPGSMAPPPKNPDLRGVRGMVDASYSALLPTLGYAVGETVPAELLRQTIPVEVDGQVVAWILPDTSMQFKLSAEEELFLQRTTLAITLAALMGVALAVAMGFWLSGRLLLPIRRLTRASQALAGGDLEQQVPVSSQDELGLLTATFNQMSADLARADQQRKRMTADITHDLSTPLQIISGYIEMLEEGQTTLTPQRLEIIKIEIEHLRRLVGDLTTLSQVEAGGLTMQFQALSPVALLRQVHQAYQPIAERQGVTLRLDAPESTARILADEGRMLQVLKNLLDNALRYTPAGGQIVMSVIAAGQSIQLRLSDSGSGIPPEDLPYVFERFYRADPSRQANSGKMGLGLAICKALVTVQGGAIAAESAGEGQGTIVVIIFPFQP